LIYADTGEEQVLVPPEMIRRNAVAWTGQPGNAAKIESVEEIDQWTVQGGLRNLRPLWKYSWPNGEQVYVSGASGEVVQYTTTTSRFWAYLGAIPHWLYFTPLRKHQARWNVSFRQSCIGRSDSGFLFVQEPADGGSANCKPTCDLGFADS
jgi:hypothetical protein